MTIYGKNEEVEEDIKKLQISSKSLSVKNLTGVCKFIVIYVIIHCAEKQIDIFKLFAHLKKEYLFACSNCYNLMRMASMMFLSFKRNETK